MATIDKPPYHRRAVVRGLIVSDKLVAHTGFEPVISALRVWQEPNHGVPRDPAQAHSVSVAAVQ